ncbi:MAG: hypothetical protein M1436_01530 [Acidobacteria bacterium]|nr:hypothetical protein [Acidobacteriota bacterium]
MLPRERVFAVLEFRPPDVVPVEYHASPAGFSEHGRKLRELWKRCPDDFGPEDRFPIPDSTPFTGVRRDAWGVLWHEKAFGAGGIPVQRPLDDWQAWPDFRFPAPPACQGPLFEGERARSACHRRRFFQKSGWVSLFELMHALRRFEDVLVDIATGAPEIHRLADHLTEYHLAYVHYLLARGVDAVQFGDDFGTQADLILSPKLWRSFFKPRYTELIKPIKRAGKKVFFHCCGNARGLLGEFADLGVDALWPQLNVYDLAELARFSRQAKVAVALHPDRGDLMIRATPHAVRRYVARLAEVFDTASGGAWFYVEVDRGFPFENVVALTETIAGLRS